MSNSPTKPRNPLRLTLIAAGAAAALWSALMFALANDDWVVLHLPTMPWNAAPNVAVVEARLFAVMLASLVAGAALASLAWWRVNALLKHRFAVEGARAQRMESELAALGRLVSTTRVEERVQKASDGEIERGN